MAAGARKQVLPLTHEQVYDVYPVCVALLL